VSAAYVAAVHIQAANSSKQPEMEESQQNYSDDFSQLSQAATSQPAAPPQRAAADSDDGSEASQSLSTSALSEPGKIRARKKAAAPSGPAAQVRHCNHAVQSTPWHVLIV
jgi:hypothetical protein